MDPVDDIIDPVHEFVVDATLGIAHNEDGSYDGRRILAALAIIAATTGAAVWIAVYYYG